MSGRTPKRVHIAQIDKNSPANAQVNKAGTGPLIGQGFFFNLYSSRVVKATVATVAAAVVFIWKEQQKLTASDAAPNDLFGSTLSMYGNTAIVGARSNDDAGNSSGSAYIFTYNGTNWTEQAKLTASDAAGGDQFGYSVSIYDNTAIVGAYRDNGAGSDSGSAYIFTYDGINWTEQANLTADDAAAYDNFGYSVSIHGNSAIIGALYDDTAGGIDSGSAYVFTTTGVDWTQQQKLIADDAAAEDLFGLGVSIYGDSAIIGAPFNGAGGSAYVFTRSGTTWTQQAKLTADDAAASDNFGWSVSIYGNTAIVGSPLDDDAGNGSGSAYVFTRSGTNWTQQAKLTASDAAGGDKFGYSVSIYGDSAIVGVRYDDDAGSDSSSAYVYTTTDNWASTTEKKLIASDAYGGDQFGYSVSIYGDSAIVGAVYSDKDATTNTGAAYVFNYTSQ